MKKNGIYAFLLAIIVIIFGLFLYNSYTKSNNYKTSVSNVYKKNFSSAVEGFDEINTDLAKVNASNNKHFINKELIKLYASTQAVVENINSIPISHTVINNVSEFLNKTGGYYYSLILNDRNLNKKEKKNIKDIYASSNVLLANLRDLEDYIENSKDGYDWINSRGDFYVNTNTTRIDNTFKTSKEQIKEYPTLIYDGPFSDSMRERKNNTYKKNITKEEAKKLLNKMLDKNISLKFESESNSNIPSYKFKYYSNEYTYTADISKKGGKLISISSNYVADENDKISIRKAIKIGKDFLNDNLGIKNMQSTYYETFDNIVTINYAYKQNNVTCYTDLIKIKVSLADGKITGLEGSNYYLAHKKRNNLKPSITKKQARNKVNMDLKITKERLALIPTETNKEKLCYEFKGKMGKDIFLVYINARTGEEEDILKVIQADKSVLTM